MRFGLRRVCVNRGFRFRCGFRLFPRLMFGVGRFGRVYGNRRFERFGEGRHSEKHLREPVFKRGFVSEREPFGEVGGVYEIGLAVLRPARLFLLLLFLLLAVVVAVVAPLLLVLPAFRALLAVVVLLAVLPVVAVVVAAPVVLAAVVVAVVAPLLLLVLAVVEAVEIFVARVAAVLGVARFVVVCGVFVLAGFGYSALVVGVVSIGVGVEVFVCRGKRRRNFVVAAVRAVFGFRRIRAACRVGEVVRPVGVHENFGLVVAAVLRAFGFFRLRRGGGVAPSRPSARGIFAPRPAPDFLFRTSLSSVSSSDFDCWFCASAAFCSPP